MTNQTRVSIIIVTHNSLPALEESLRSLDRGLAQISGCQVVVVDNASSDKSPDCVRRYFSDARVIINGENRGFASACNQGARGADGEYLLFHNPDVEVDVNAIGTLLKACEELPEVGAVGGRMRFPDGRFQATCRNFPSIANMLFSRGSALSFMRKGRGEYTLPDYAEATAVGALAGTLMMIRRDIFTSHDGFDERFFMYMEDTDLCLRLRNSGLKNYFVPTAGAVHLWGKGSRAGRTRRRWYHHVSVWKYFVKHFPDGLSVIVLPVILAINFAIGSLLPGPERRQG